MALKLTKDQRRAIIVRTGLEIVREHGGLEKLTFEEVEKHAKPSTSKHTVKYWFKTRDALWAAVIAADETGEAKKQADEMGWSVDD